MGTDDRAGGGQLGRGDLLRVVLRSFTLQASWNYRWMQSMGFLFSILPGLKRIHRDEKELGEAAVRHLELFNAQPYLASYALGTTLRMEEELEKAGPGSPEALGRWKRTLSSSLGAVGDSLFWRSFRPACGVTAVLLAFGTGWIASLIYLIIFNTLHIFVRVRGVFSGYIRGQEVLSDLKGPLFSRFPFWLEDAVCFMAGALVVILMAGGGGLPGIEREWIVYPVLIGVFRGLLGFLGARILLYATSGALALGVLLWEFF